MPSKAYTSLRDFLTNRMRMSHVYQPIMLRLMLTHGGKATIREIARSFLNEDRSQLEYYERITKEMPGKVLTRHRIVERDGNTYRLAGPYADLSETERKELAALCEAKLEEYLMRRGDAPWSHRKISGGYIPGSLRYDILKRAKGRCECCGTPVEERAIEVDHIIPRNRGGSDDPSNLQALCYVCNAQKRDRDDTDFGKIRKSFEDRLEGCLFCELPAKRIVSENSLALAVRDNYPVTPLHTLIIPKRHVVDYFDLHSPERNALQELLEAEREVIRREDGEVSGFNVGVNCGETAGQSVFHVHMHLIPRREGDVANPRGGVRGVIPGKQTY
jgi:diadenosine tetraphosphate (Ap4A) HIT family hydrolase/5-methylcytosine-specific restriction endonuclease McrA